MLRSGRETHPRRLRGVDAARGLALIGMAATHIFPSFRPDGTLHPAYDIAAGRAAALFAVLAGVGLALANGGQQPPTGRNLTAARAGALARAVLLLGLGLALGMVDSPPLVILAYYALLFAIGTAFLGWSARTLALAAAAAAVVTPVASHIVRQYVAPTPIEDPGGPDLLKELFLTGTYPVLTWTTYLLAGLAVGRTDLRRWSSALRLVVLGALLAVGARALSVRLLDAVGGPGDLRGGFQGDTSAWLERGLFGTTPRDDWQWLTVAAPHTGTTLDLAHTVGTSFVVLGVCLVLARVLKALLLPLVAAGSMTLTLYSAHVLALADRWEIDYTDRQALWLAHVGIALVVATLWRTYVGRGPLEALSARLDRTARDLVSGRSRAVASRL